MTSRFDINLGNVQKTLFLPLWGRAMETRKKRPTLVDETAAGVFCYFKEEDIKGFIIRLMDAYPNSEILFDACSPIGVRVANKKVIESAGLDEKSHLIWGLKDK